MAARCSGRPDHGLPAAPVRPAGAATAALADRRPSPAADPQRGTRHRVAGLKLRATPVGPAHVAPPLPSPRTGHPHGRTPLAHPHSHPARCSRHVRSRSGVNICRHRAVRPPPAGARASACLAANLLRNPLRGAAQLRLNYYINGIKYVPTRPTATPETGRAPHAAAGCAACASPGLPSPATG